MKTKKNFIVMLLSFACIISITCQSAADDAIVRKIRESLLESYDNKEFGSVFERIILDIGRKSYVKMLDQWEKKHEEIDEIKFEDESSIKGIKSILHEYADEYDFTEFCRSVYKLKLLCLKNFDLYFSALKENGIPENPDMITCDYIDSCMNNYKYFNFQKELYDEEFRLKNIIKTIMKSKKVKTKLLFYSCIFELINNQREKTINRLLKKYLTRLSG